jgi:hypothetical protein
MKDKRVYASDIMYDIPLPSLEGEKASKYVATISYQIPRRIILKGRVKVSPKFDTWYGMIYWLNKQPYHIEYVIYKTDRADVLRSGIKKIGEVLK